MTIKIGKTYRKNNAPEITAKVVRFSGAEGIAFQSGGHTVFMNAAYFLETYTLIA